MDPKTTQKDFHKTADAERFRNRLGNPFLQAKEQELAALIAEKMPSSGRRLLEVGCGEGSNFMYLREKLPDVELTGADFSFEKIRFMNAFVDGAAGVCADATGLPFKKQLFDVVLFRDLLHHVNWAREQVVSEAFRVLRPGGAVIVMESNGKAFLNRVFQILFPAERGMKDSTRGKLMALGKKFGETEMEFVEVSFLVRAVAFVFGWPSGMFRYFVGAVCALALAWEKVVARLKPKTAWTYMMLCIRRDEGSAN